MSTQQGQAQPAAVVTPPAPPHKTLLNKPKTFDGNKQKFRAWARKTWLYVNDCQELNNHQQIHVALSYISGPNVDEWVGNYYGYKHVEATAMTGPSWTQGYTQFWKDLEEWFTDANQK